MGNVMSLPSAACEKFQSWGKVLILNICCFVVNVLSVAISRCFYLNMVGNMRVNWQPWGKKSQKLLVWKPCGIKKEKGINASKKSVFFYFNVQFSAVLMYIWFWRNLLAFG